MPKPVLYKPAIPYKAIDLSQNFHKLEFSFH